MSISAAAIVWGVCQNAKYWWPSKQYVSSPPPAAGALLGSESNLEASPTLFSPPGMVLAAMGRDYLHSALWHCQYLAFDLPLPTPSGSRAVTPRVGATPLSHVWRTHPLADSPDQLLWPQESNFIPLERGANWAKGMPSTFQIGE